MSAQTRYGYSTPIGSAGGIVDLAPYAVDTFLNEEETGTLKFGMGLSFPQKLTVLISTYMMHVHWCLVFKHHTRHA